MKIVFAAAVAIYASANLGVMAEPAMRTRDDALTVSSTAKADGILFTTSNGVVVHAEIRDRTSLKGMQPKALEILMAMAKAAKPAGITKIVITAGRGEGHKSHARGTEMDLKGYDAHGKLWTTAQRVAIARGGAAAGANRFGLYSFGQGYLGSGSLHIGYSGDGRPSAVWGYKGLTGGPASRAFTDSAEKQFLVDFNRGNLGR